MFNIPRFTTSLAVVASFLAVPASAELLYENGSGGSTLLYGQFNPAYQSVDDGQVRTNTLVDSGHSNSRVGIWVRQPTSFGAFSFNFETGLGFRQSFLVSQGFTPDAWNWQRVNLRKIDFALKTDRAGTFSLGQGSMGTDGTAQSDLSGTTLVNYVAIGDTAGAFRFRTTAGALSTRTIGAVMQDFDGGRRGRIRYDSPSFSGFTISAAYGEEILVQNSDRKEADIALRYLGETGGFKMAGAIGYSDVETTPGVRLKSTIGSFSALHDSGFNVTLAAGSRKNGGSYGYGKLGYIARWLSVGTTAIAIDYYRGSDFVVNGSKSDAYGLGIVQKFDNANVEAYLGLRNYGLSEPGVQYSDMKSVLVGARWKF